MKRFILALSTFFYSSLYTNEINLIDSLQVTKNAIIIKPNQELSQFFLIDNFMLQYDEIDVDLRKLDSSITMIPFLLHAIPIIWQQDKTYLVDRMDADLFESLTKIKKIFRLFYPTRNWHGELKAKTLVKNSYTDSPEFHANRNAVIIPFSGGVDSIYNSLATIDKKQYLVSICGGDVPIANKEFWHEVKQHCSEYAQQYKVPLSYVRSNFAGMYNGKHEITHPAVWTYMTQGLGYTSLMLPLMVAKGIPFCLIGSASVVDYPWPYGSHPLIEHSLQVAGCYSFHFGGEFTRSEKLGKMLEICKKNSLPKPKLRVCWTSGSAKNCDACFSKCIVTMVCLLVEGENYEDFGFYLPLDHLIRRMKNYVTEKPFDVETMWKWRFVQRRIKELKEKGVVYRQEIDEFLVWLENLDLDALVDKNKLAKFSEGMKSILTSLWSASMEVAHARFHQHFA